MLPRIPPVQRRNWRRFGKTRPTRAGSGTPRRYRQESIGRYEHGSKNVHQGGPTGPVRCQHFERKVRRPGSSVPPGSLRPTASKGRRTSSLLLPLGVPPVSFRSPSSDTHLVAPLRPTTPRGCCSDGSVLCTPAVATKAVLGCGSVAPRQISPYQRRRSVNPAGRRIGPSCGTGQPLPRQSPGARREALVRHHSRASRQAVQGSSEPPERGEAYKAPGSRWKPPKRQRTSGETRCQALPKRPWT